MLILDATTRSLEIDLNAAVAANQLPFVASYVDMAKGIIEVIASSSNTGASNSTTAVTLVAAPTSANFTRHLKYLSIRNAVSAFLMLWIQVNDNATLREIWKGTLAIGDSLIYTDALGFNVLDTNGRIKVGAGVSGPGATTDNALVRWDGTGGTNTQNSAVIVDDSNNVTGVVALTVTGTVTLSGTAANIATGANFISYAGTETGFSLDSSDNATLSAQLVVVGQLSCSTTIVTNGGSLAVNSDPDTNAYALDASTSDKQLTDGSQFTLSGGNNFSGFIVVTETQATGETALFICGGGATVLVSQTSIQWDDADTPGVMCIFQSGANVVLKNRNGGTRTFGVAMIRTRTS